MKTTGKVNPGAMLAEIQRMIEPMTRTELAALHGEMLAYARMFGEAVEAVEKRMRAMGPDPN